MYKENLYSIQGETCPPAHAIEPQNLSGYRLVTSVPPTENDFASHQMLGKTRPHDVDECKWSSCSLFLEESKLLKATGLPKFKGKWAGIVQVNLAQGSGRVVRNLTNGHIDWWRYAGHDAVAASTVTTDF